MKCSADHKLCRRAEIDVDRDGTALALVEEKRLDSDDRPLGPSPARSHILRAGASALVTAMGRTGVTRIVVVSASGAYVAGNDPLSRFVTKPILERVLRANNVDTRAMDAVLAASATEWTSLRPSRLIDGKMGDTYRAQVDRVIRWRYNTRFETVGRAAVDALTRPEWIRHAVYITE